MKQMEFHEVAALFPMMEGKDFDDLKADIAEHGLLQPIRVFESKVLDGRNRYKACLELDIEPTIQEYAGDDPVGFVVSLNLKRRQLTESQRAMVAAKMANMPRGRRESNVPPGADLISVPEAAAKMEVGYKSAQRARRVLKEGGPDLVAAVETGKTSVKKAAASLVGKGADGKKTTEGRSGVRTHKEAPYEPDTPRKGVLAGAQKDRVDKTLYAFEAGCDILARVDWPMALSVCNDDELRVWIRNLASFSTQLKSLSKKLEKGDGNVSDS